MQIVPKIYIFVSFWFKIVDKTRLICYNKIMNSVFDVQNLDRLLQDFYAIVKIRIAIFDNAFRLVSEYPKSAPKYCALIRSTKRGEEGCRRCDEAACMRAMKLRAPHIYTCHAGLTEAITPIQMGGSILGYAVLAHMLPAEDYNAVTQRACILAEKYGVLKEKSVAALSSITVKTAAEMDAGMRILDAVASYMYIKNFAVWKNGDIAAEMEKYIKNNLQQPLSSEVLCKQFNLSRSNLYRLSLKAFGMGIMQYIGYCRIEKAKELLLENKSVSQISDECGYTEYNYFCKVFKTATGLSPSAYRKAKTDK